MSVQPSTALTPEQAQEVSRKMATDALRQRLTPGPDKKAKLKEACEGFEAVFIGQMLKEMRKSVPKDGLLHGKYEDQYVSMFDEELSKTLAKQGGIGLSEFMQRQLAERDPKTPKDASALGGGPRATALDTMPTRAASTQAKPGDIWNRKLSQPAGVLTPEAPQAAVRTGQSQPQVSASSLAGTASQHLGQPGAQYLTGKDAELAALPKGMTAPVAGELSSNFGWRRDPFTGQRAWHAGVDIAAQEGSPVRAAMDGVVSFSGQKGGYGNVVIVDHGGGVQSVYGHNKANGVMEGQAVKAGQVIAQVGQTGRSTGPHLHFEIRRNAVAVNPLDPGGTMLAEASGARIPIPDL